MKRSGLKSRGKPLKRSAFKSKRPATTRKKPKRPKLRSVAKLKKDLWAVFTKYIKQRDNYVCQTCGRKVEGQNAQGGHYIAKAACGLEYYFSEKNVHCQCSNCNLRLEGNRHAYRPFLVSTYGETVVRDIETNYHTPTPWSREVFQEKIAHYTKLLEEQSPA